MENNFYRLSSQGKLAKYWNGLVTEANNFFYTSPPKKKLIA